MGKIFDLDSPLMRFLGKMTDLLWLNLLTVLCCIPIVTAGAGFTALHFVCLKLVRGEEGYITKDFFRSFKENFKQATIIWLIFLAFATVMVFDFWYMYQMVEAGSLKGWGVIIVFAGLCVACIFAIFTLMFVFPVLSHFGNSIKGTLRNSFMMSVLVLPKTLLMVILLFVPLAVWYFVSQIAPLAWLYWFSGPAYVSALLYNKTFKRFEPKKEEINDDFSWTVGGGEDTEEPGVESNLTGSIESQNTDEEGTNQ